MFWVFTYAVFTYRANLRYGDAYELVSTIRLVSTSVGAGLYWLLLSYLIDSSRPRPRRPLAILATILPASIIVLLARLLLDQLGASNPNGFAGDVRFVLVWGGYFGLWASAAFAIRVTPWLSATAETPPPQPKLCGMARAELLERLALEISTLPRTERKALLQCFQAPAGYESADDLDEALRTYRPTA